MGQYAMHRWRRPARRAFTMIELLVVIGVIMVLLGLLVPILAGSFAAGKTTRQLVIVQQLAALTMSYASDFRDVYPIASYPTSPHAARNFTEALRDAGFLAAGDEAKYEFQNANMSECMLYPAERMEPGYTEHWDVRTPSAVRTTQVRFPAIKGMIRVHSTADGSLEGAWCCVPWSPPGPVAFCDGSAGNFVWRELLAGELYVENGIGVPVATTWSGYLGRDRQN